MPIVIKGPRCVLCKQRKATFYDRYCKACFTLGMTDLNQKEARIKLGPVSDMERWTKRQEAVEKRKETIANRQHDEYISLMEHRRNLRRNGAYGC